MKNVSRKEGLIATIFLFLSVGIVSACGPYFPIFFHTPQVLSKLTFSEVGLDFSNIDTPDVIIPDDVDIKTLFPIYRKIIGKPLSYQTKKSLYYVAPDPVYEYTDIEPSHAIYPPTPLELWKKEKDGTVLTPSGVLKGACSDSVYMTAIATLKNRKFIYSKSDVLLWISNQENVFALCGQVNKSAEVITREKKSNWFTNFTVYVKSFFKKKEVMVVIHTTQPKCVTRDCLFEVKYQGILQQDYEYQQAATSFYKADYGLASRQFKVIAETKDHPWQAYATYSLGRVYLQLGQSLNLTETYDEKAMEQFKILMSKKDFKIVSSNELKDLRDNAQDIIYRLTYKKDITILETTDTANVIEIAFDSINSGVVSEDVLKGSQYIQWERAWTGTTTETLSVAKEKYKETKQPVWLIPIARHIKKSDSMFSDISTAIQKLPPSFPAYWTVQYYLIKAYIDADDIVGAKKLLAQLPNTTSPTVWDYIEDLRMVTSGNLVEMFRHSIRYSITTDYISEDRDSKKIQQIKFIDDKAKDVFSLVPIEKQADIFSLDDVLPKDQTELVRLTIFVRAILSGNFSVADKMAVLISKNNQSIGNDLKEYIQAKNIEDKKFTSAMFMLKYPGIGLWLYDDAVVKVSYKTLSTAMIWEDNLITSYKTVSNFDYNRWNYCHPYEYVEGSTDYKTKLVDLRKSSYALSFLDTMLSKNDVASAIEQSKSMYAIPPNYFAEIILAYTQSHPNSSRVPEALSLATKMTKYSTCKNDDTSKYSKKLYDVLHNKYPSTTWAKQTPFFY